MGGPVIRVGPGWQIALMDCLDLDWPDKSVHHVIADPPYESHMHRAKANARGRRHDGTAVSKPLDFADIGSIRAAAARRMVALSQGWVIVFCTPEGVAPWRDALEAAGAKYKRACVWVKPDATPQLNGQGPAMGAEMFVCAWAGSGYARWNAGGKRGVYTHLTNPPGRDGRHPTEKPVALMADLIQDFTDPGQTVFDPFMGGGSTGVAALRHGRRFTGTEIDPAYFAVAEQRLAVAGADMFGAAASAAAPIAVDVALPIHMPRLRKPKPAAGGKAAL